MITKIVKRITMFLFILLAAYLAVGYLFHLVIFPETKPAVSSYFKPGQQFYSKAEGFRQQVMKQENGFVYCKLEIEPFAGGPPKHIHAGFDETFEISNGELSIWLDGEVVKLHPGKKLLIPRGVPHKPYNETADTIHIKQQVAFPEKFAYHLPQVYGVMDHQPGFGSMPGTMLQMSLFSSEGFDSYVADGPPVFIQKAMGFLLAPITRLMGYKSFYPEYDLR